MVYRLYRITSYNVCYTKLLRIFGYEYASNNQMEEFMKMSYMEKIRLNSSKLTHL